MVLCSFFIGSKGFVRYYNVTPGPHNFRIVALTNSGERVVTRRRIFIGILLELQLLMACANSKKVL